LNRNRNRNRPSGYRVGILSVTWLVLKRFVMSSYYVRHALQTIQVSPPTRGDLKNTQEHRFLVF
jgi:hypothetical protein